MSTQYTPAIGFIPEVLQLAKIQAVTEKKTLGEWLEEAIKDKVGKIVK